MMNWDTVMCDLSEQHAYAHFVKFFLIACVADHLPTTVLSYPTLAISHVPPTEASCINHKLR